MVEEMRTEAIELSITACEKYAQNYEVSGKQSIPELPFTLDRHYPAYDCPEYIGIFLYY